ncbi:MAG: FKBP-type peptidyl-prolyl cis-trans isomerase [Patescibacteria group bacterium]|nr:FKBP-type peptidyl-prolyl cis-trans isomerase [Patescibacteria group bacterium]
MKQTILFIIIAVVVIVGAYWFTHNQPSTATENKNNMQEQTQFQIIDQTVGTGDAVKSGDTVEVNYVGTLENGTKFDSSYDRGTPFSFTVGAGQVIQGWEQGLIGMKVGGKRKLIIPYTMGYGEQGMGPIPPKATLIFEIELLKIQNPSH